MIQRRPCANHPERPGHATCMSCRKVVCQECASTWDGIHYCMACLAARRRSAGGGAGSLAWVATVVAILMLLLLHVRLTVWTGALAARLL